MDDNEKILSVKNLSTHFATEDGVAKAVGNVSFDIKKGKTLFLRATLFLECILYIPVR